jgi:hypothetical protein
MTHMCIYGHHQLNASMSKLIFACYLIAKWFDAISQVERVVTYNQSL